MVRFKASSSADSAKKPAKQGRVAQLRTLFVMTRQADPAVVWWMLLSVLGITAAGYLIGLLVGHPIYVTLLAFPVGLMLAMLILARRAETAAYSRLAGQPGASALALQNLRKGWVYEETPVAVDPKTQDLVFRVIGRPGVVLIAEGPTGRAGKLADGERKRISRILGAGVPVHVLLCGESVGQIPLRKLSGHILKLKPAMSKDQVSEVSRRLRALGGLRPPIPKGIDPTRVRPDRKATRGR